MIKEEREFWKAIEQLTKQHKDTDERMKRARKDTDERIERAHKATDERMERVRKEFEEDMKRIHKEVDERMERVHKEVARVTDGWGRWVEGSVAPSAVKTFLGLGYKVLNEYHRWKVYDDGQVAAEYDTLLAARKGKKKVLFIGEAKSFFDSNNVKDFLNDLQEAHDYLEEFRNYEMVGFVAGVNYGKGADKFAVKKGLYVFKPSGDAMVLDVPKWFKPKIW